MQNGVTGQGGGGAGHICTIYTYTLDYGSGRRRDSFENKARIHASSNEPHHIYISVVFDILEEN